VLSGIKAPAACEVFTDVDRTAPYDREQGHDPMNLTSLDASEEAGGWRLCRLTSSAPRDPEREKATTSKPGACLTVIQVQPLNRLRHRCLCRCGWRRIGFVRPIVTRRVAAMPCMTWLAAVVRAPVSFRRKETGAVWRSEVCRKGRLLQRSEEGPSSAAAGRSVE